MIRWSLRARISSSISTVSRPAHWVVTPGAVYSYRVRDGTMTNVVRNRNHAAMIRKLRELILRPSIAQNARLADALERHATARVYAPFVHSQTCCQQGPGQEPLHRNVDTPVAGLAGPEGVATANAAYMPARGPSGRRCSNAAGKDVTVTAPVARAVSLPAIPGTVKLSLMQSMTGYVPSSRRHVGLRYPANARGWCGRRADGGAAHRAGPITLMFKCVPVLRERIWMHQKVTRVTGRRRPTGRWGSRMILQRSTRAGPPQSQRAHAVRQVSLPLRWSAENGS